MLSGLAAGYAQAFPASSSLPPRQLQMAETLATAIAEQIARPQGEEARRIALVAVEAARSAMSAHDINREAVSAPLA